MSPNYSFDDHYAPESTGNVNAPLTIPIQASALRKGSSASLGAKFLTHNLLPNTITNISKETYMNQIEC
jgi:hypothetical protein